MSSPPPPPSSSSSCNLISYLLTRFLNQTNNNCNTSSESLLKDYARREFNAFLWISLIIITALLLDKLYTLFRLWFVARGITGPPCTFLFGHSKLLAELHNKYGSILKLWLGPARLMVSITDPVLIKEMLLKAEDKLPFTGKAFRLAFGQSNLFFSSYDQAQKRRESLSSQLNEKSVPRENVISKHVIDRIMERIDKDMIEGKVDCKLISQHMAFTVLGTKLFGDAFLAWSQAASYEELLMEIAEDASFWASYRITPFWERGFWRYQSLCTSLKCLTQDIIQQCRKNCKLFHHVDRNLNDESIECGIKVASDIPSGGTQQDQFSSKGIDGILNAREELCGNITGMMFHGCISTAGLLGSILERLGTDPEFQDKIYSEIIRVQKHSAKDVQNVDETPLLLATIYESARLLPTGPLLQRCCLKHDLKLKNGVTIPAGAVLVVPVHLLRINDDIWGSDACKYNPYRFLLKAEVAENTGAYFQSSFILKDPNENAAFLPFGSGIRACVGQKSAIKGVAALLASLLERYEVRLQSRSENDPESASPLVVFVKRNN